MKLFDLYSNENSNIDQIIKMYVGKDVNVAVLKKNLTKDGNHINSVIEKFTKNKRVTTISK